MHEKCVKKNEWKGLTWTNVQKECAERRRVNVSTDTQWSHKKKSAKKTYFNRTNEKKAPRQSTASIQSINTDTLANIYYRNIPWENKNHIIYTPVWNDKYTFSLYIYGTKHRH